MTVRSCPGCGASHVCDDPLLPHLGAVIRFRNHEKVGRSSRVKIVEREGTITELHEAEYGPTGWLSKSEVMTVECTDGIARVVDGFNFLQRLGDITVITPAAGR